MTFQIPAEQRVLTRAEYAALGYVERGDLSRIDMQMLPDKPLSRPLFPVYRAETKEQYFVDLGVGIVKAGASLSSGGLVPAARTIVGYTWSLLT